MEALRYGREIRWLLQSALLIFLVTVGLGMARGLGLVDFTNANQVLTHLHSGVLGWITLGIMAAVLWLYGGTGARRGEERYVTWTSILLIIAVPLFMVAWWILEPPFLAVTGSLVLLGIVLFVAWLVREAGRIGYRNLTTPQLGAVVGLITLVVGSALGVLIATQEAGGAFELPGDPHGAHAETQISAYLVLVSMSIAYWRLHGNDRTGRGTAMVWLFFAGGAIVAIALLANVIEAAILYVPLDITAFLIFLSLAWRQVVAPGWFTADSRRHYAVAIPFALVYLAIFVYLVVGFAVLKLWTDITEVPVSLLAGSSHPLFVGMVTNTLFGLLFDLNRGKRPIWPWADHVVFWGISVATAAFTVAILLEADDAFKFITPVLGVSILIGIVAHTLRLQSRETTSPSLMPVG